MPRYCMQPASTAAFTKVLY